MPPSDRQSPDPLRSSTDPTHRPFREPRLDQRAIDRALKADRNQGDIVLHDHEVRGLRLVVRKQTATWVVPYRPTGFADFASRTRHKQRWEKLGTVADVSLAEARRAAKRVKARAAEGIDPKAEKAAKREAREEAERRARIEAAGRVSCTARLKDYHVILASRGRSAAHVRDEIGQIIGALVDMGVMQRPKQGEEPACTIAPAEITPVLVDRMLANAPEGSRRHRFGALARFLRWAMKGEDKRPATEHFERHERPAAVESRDRWLTGPEVAAVWRACDELHAPVLRDLIRFMITTPCREGEAATVCWGHVDLAARQWEQRAKSTKNKTAHMFPLNDRALEILTRRRWVSAEAGPVRDDELIFPSPLESRVVTGWSKTKRALDKASGVTGWRFHDLRRTCATHLSEAGFDADLVDGLLNHKQSKTRSGVKGIHNRARRMDARAEALACWSYLIDCFLAGTQPDIDAFHARFDEMRAKEGATVVRLHAEAGAAA